MSILDRMFSWNGDSAPVVATSPAPKASTPTGFGVQAYSTFDLARDVGFPDFLRNGLNAAAAVVNRRTAMRNASVRRSVNLISNAIGSLPFQLLQEKDGGDREKAKKHPLYRLLARRPNSFQTAFEFRRLMQRWLLIEGNAHALIVRGRNGPTSLVPLAPGRVQAKQRDDWTVEYKIKRGSGSFTEVPAEDILHLRGDGHDGINGCSLVEEAAEVLGLAIRADDAAARLFRNGTMVGGTLESDKKLSPEAIERLASSMEARFQGGENAHRTMVLEEGLKFKEIGSNAKDAQNLEARKHQIEEVARLFGVPRPFLFLDDTSWGSGIETLGIFLVQYTLAPWFVCWEQAVSRVLLTEAEVEQGYYPKFNERALLRGSMKDQAEYLSKLLGAGGAPQAIEQNEARGWLDLPAHADGSGLSKGAMNKGQGGADGSTGKN